MIIANPATYLTIAKLKDMALDYDLSTYSDLQVSDMLVRATSVADSMMHKSYLATEVMRQYQGDGTNRLHLARRPLLYIKKIELVMPGVAGFTLALDQILIDYPQGLLKIFQPLLWSGSYFAMFPSMATIEVTFAHGYGYAVTPPTTVITDNPGGNLAPGSYDVAITAKTPWGETSATPQTVTSSSGALYVNVKPVLGASVYRAFAAPHGATPLMFVGESPHTAYGASGVGILISALTAPIGFWPDTLPAIDTSAHPIPAAMVEATRLIFLAALYEQNNLANRGVGTTRSGGKTVQWRSTTGTSDKGTPNLMDQARALLANYATLTLL